MATQAKTGAGIKLKIDNGDSPMTFTAVAEVKNLKFPGMTMSFDDVTSLDSPADENGVVFKEYIPTVADTGDIDFNYNYTTAATGGVVLLLDAFTGKLHSFEIVFPEMNTDSPPVNKTITATGYVSVVDQIDVQVDKARGGTGKIKLTGPYSRNW